MADEFEVVSEFQPTPYLRGRDSGGEVSMEVNGEDLMIEHQVAQNYGGSCTERVFFPMVKVVELLVALGYQLVKKEP